MTTQSKSSVVTLAHFKHLTDCLYSIEKYAEDGTLDKIVEQLARAKDNPGRMVYTAGNGGSSNNASHMAAHLCDVGIRATCLTDNSGLSSARANDHTFAAALWNSIPYLTQSDTIIAFSCSGTSTNIANLLLQAKRAIGAFTIGIFGCPSIYQDDLDFLDIHMALNSQNYGAIEDAHSVVVHLIKDLLMT